MDSGRAWPPRLVAGFFPAGGARAARCCRPDRALERTGRDVVRTIRSSTEVEEVFREGSRVSHPLVIALIRKTPERRGPQGRVAFIAGKRLGGAVTRNRAKRVLRSAARRAGAPWTGVDTVLIARPETAVSSEKQLDEALVRLGERIERGTAR